MVTDDVGERSQLIGDLFRHNAVPATGMTVVDLADRRPAALKIASVDRDEPLDATTVLRCLNVLQQNGRAPVVPVVVEVPPAELGHLVDPQQFSYHPMVASIDASRALDTPAETLRLIGLARSRGWELGLHGVGRDHASLAAVAMFEPALATLAPEVVAAPTSALAMETLQTLTAFGHSSGATVMAERLADADQVGAAQALTASLGSGSAVRSGWVELPEDLDYTLDLFTPPPQPDPRRTPFEIASLRHEPRRSRKPLLVSLSQRLEATAKTSGRSSLVFADFQYADKISPATRKRYADLVPAVELITMVARDLRTAPVAGVSTIELPRGDPLVDEWVMLVLAPTSAALLSAHDLHRRVRREADREFDYVLTYDRDLVAHAARSLLTRLARR